MHRDQCEEHRELKEKKTHENKTEAVFVFV